MICTPISGFRVSTAHAYSGSTLDMAALRGQLRALANDRNLRRFVVQARSTGRQLGTGSYGTVEEVQLATMIIIYEVVTSHALFRLK